MSQLLLPALFALFGLQEPGTSVMPFLRTAQGARAAALGECYVGMADDASSLYWNPAGLGRLRQYHLALSHHQWFMDTKDELVHAVLPAAAGAFGLGLAYSAESDIEEWNADNVLLDTFRTWNGVATLGYGVNLGRLCFLGTALKGFYQDIYSTAGYGGAFDLGFLCQPTGWLGLGIAGRNMGAATGYTPDLEMLPAEGEVGASLALERFNVGLGIALPLDGSPALRCGLEYLPMDQLAVRLGYRTGPVDLATLGPLAGLTTGLGVRLGSLTFDYSFTPYGKLGQAHRLGLETRITRKGLGAVRVRVVEAARRAPVQADLVLSGTREAVVRTDRRGELTLTRLVRGSLIIRTAVEGFAPRIDTMYVLGDREQTAVLSLTRLEYGSLAGATYDALTRKPAPGLVTYRGPVQGEVTTGSELGSFMVKNIPAGSYVVTASGPNHAYSAQTCTVAVDVGRVARRDFFLVRGARPGTSASPPAGAGPVQLRDIAFASGRAEVSPEFEPVLARVAEMLKADPNLTVELAGHTDPAEALGPEFPSHWELSQARAEAVRQHLNEKLGIAFDRLSANGYADTQPVGADDTEASRQRNRRVEIRFIGQ